MEVETVKIGKPLNLDELKGIEQKGIDLWKFHKKETVIVSSEVLQMPSQYSPTGKQWVLKVSSDTLETTQGGKEGEPIEFRASILLNLVQDDKGELKGFSMSDKSNFYAFVTDIGIRNLQDKSLGEVVRSLVGKKAIVKAYDKEVSTQQGMVKRTYLTFSY